MPVYPLNRELTWLLPPTLDELIPEDHPARFVAAFVDGLERSVWEEMEISLEGNPLGAPSYNPRGMLSVWLYGFMTGTRSNRKLETACRDQMPYLWLTGWEHPDHNSLWRFYNAHRGFMRQLFKRTVGTAIKLGLVDLAVQAVDGTKIAANASKKRTYDAAQLQELMKKTEAAIEELEAQNEAGTDPAPVHLPEKLADKKRLLAQVKAAMAELAEEGQKRINLTDGEALLLKASHNTRIVGYNMEVMVSAAKAPEVDTVVTTVGQSASTEAGVLPAPAPEVDTIAPTICQSTPTEAEVSPEPAPEANTVVPTVGQSNHTEAGVLPAPALEVDTVVPIACQLVSGAASVALPPETKAKVTGRIITAVDVIAAQNDFDQLIPMLEQSEENTGKGAYFCLADANFHSGPNLGACAQREQVVVMSEPHEKDLKKPYHKDHFVYDANSDSYTCPQGQTLKFKRIRLYRNTPVRVYSASGAICCGCPALGTCTVDRSNGRRLEIGPYDFHLRRHREWMSTQKAKDLYKKRKELPEPVFGIIKEQQGARRFLLRGLANVRAEATLLATAFNMRTICSMWRKGVASVGQWVRAGAGQACGSIHPPAGRWPEKQDIRDARRPGCPSKSLLRPQNILEFLSSRVVANA